MKEKLGVLRNDDADINLPSRNLSVYAYLELRKTNVRGEHPIKIRIVYNRKYRDYGTKQNVTINQY